MPEVKGDRFSNIYQATITESAAAALTYAEINLGLTLFQKKAILINRIVIDWGWATLQALLAGSDTVMVGLCQSNQPAAISLEYSSTIWKAQKGLMVLGTPASAFISDVVDNYDLTNIPGGGEFIVPSPLYLALQTASLSGVRTITFRMYFQVVDLKPEEYFELLESRHFYG
jgi:hypothetical protein